MHFSLSKINNNDKTNNLLIILIFVLFQQLIINFVLILPRIKKKQENIKTSLGILCNFNSQNAQICQRILEECLHSPF